MQPDEAQLLWRLWRGDTKAFSELVNQYKGMVLNLAARMTGRPDTAEDVAQEVFLRVWKALPKFRGECKLSTWIYRITINLCIAEGKTAHGRSEFVAIDEPGVMAQPQLRTESDNEYAEEVILKERMIPLIAQMPEHYRTAITLYYLKDFSYQEISDVMEVPMGTVKSYLYRGKAWLRDRLLGRETAEED
ncbi:sigma-70 family RNA polymerase sigma factor [candidate division KSB1 bacterium]|nr:MAG: sigma-70 family RNA polymerase sigma factor [candidate division KSB1 bacterium]